MKKIINIFMICAVAAGLCLLFLFAGGEKEAVSHSSEEDTQDQIEEVDISLQYGPDELVRLDETKLKVPVDFASWKERNQDVYAWIRIPDTMIDYPILQGGPDDSYYLDHTIDGVKGYPGSIYTEKVNAKDFMDFNTVIYGHNMKDGTMFKHLHKFEDKEFFDSHEFFEIYTEEGTKIYRVYAAVVYSDRHIMYAFDYNDPEGRLAFLDSLHTGESKNHFREGMSLDEDSRLVTLATCIGGRPENRWLLVASLVE